MAIFMENHPNLVFYWLGLAKIGAVGALVNYNLRDKPLLHCLEAANAQAFVFGSEMTGGKAVYKKCCFAVNLSTLQVLPCPLVTAFFSENTRQLCLC